MAVEMFPCLTYTGVIVARMRVCFELCKDPPYRVFYLLWFLQSSKPLPSHSSEMNFSTRGAT